MIGGVKNFGVEVGRKEVIILRRREGWSEEDRFRCGGARLRSKIRQCPPAGV